MITRLLFATIQFLAGMVCLIIAYVMWRRRVLKWVPPYIVTLIAIAEWCFTGGMVLLAQTEQMQLVWLNLTYLGITSIPLSWFLFITYYTGRYDYKHIRIWPFLIHPILINLIVWTDTYHHLFRGNVWFVNYGGFPAIQTSSGYLFIVHTLYSYGLLFYAFILLFRSAVETHGRQGVQALLLILSSTFPVITNIIYVLGWLPSLVVDLTPFSFMLTGLFVYIVFHRYGVFELLPVARETLIEHLRDPVFIIDRADKIVDFNAASDIAFSHQDQALVGCHIVNLIPGYPLLISQLSDDEPIVLPLKTKTSPSPTLYEVRLVPFNGDKGAFNGGILVLHDVTTEQHAREILSSYAERLRVLHAIDQAILAAEQPAHIAKAGLFGLQHLLDYSAALVLTRDAVDGFDFLTMLNLRGPDIALKEWPQALKDSHFQAGLPLRNLDLSTATNPTPLETYLISRDVMGYLVIPMVMASELMGVMAFEFDKPNAFSNEQLDAALQVTVSLAVTLHNANLRLSLQHELQVRQRTEAALRASEAALRDYAAELEAQNAELDSFAHTVAHDIKQPLAQLIGYASLLESEYNLLPEETLLLCVNAIARSSRKMSSITEELLLLASVRKLDDVDMRPVNMANVIPEVLQRLETMIMQSGASVTVAETWPTVMGYAPWIEEVWTNYVSNAIKYGGEPPIVELGWNLEPPPADGDQRTANVRFWVRDNGKGLTAEEQTRLFVPFERLEQVRVQGHGLGLSIVQRIITRMNGRVGLESKSVPGEGSLFYFTLPLPE